MEKTPLYVDRALCDEALGLLKHFAPMRTLAMVEASTRSWHFREEGDTENENYWSCVTALLMAMASMDKYRIFVVENKPVPMPC